MTSLRYFLPTSQLKGKQMAPKLLQDIVSSARGEKSHTTEIQGSQEGRWGRRRKSWAGCYSALHPDLLLSHLNPEHLEATFHGYLQECTHSCPVFNQPANPALLIPSGAIIWSIPYAPKQAEKQQIPCICLLQPGCLKTFPGMGCLTPELSGGAS